MPTNQLLDKMTQQFDQMKAIAEENYKMAEQAIKERDAARDALRAILPFVERSTIAAHSDNFAPVTLRSDAIQAAKSILGDK